MTTLIPFKSLTLTPEPSHRPTESRASAAAAALRRWKRGKEALTVTHDGATLTPDDIDWDTLPRTSGPSGEGITAHISARTVERLARLVPRHYPTRTAAIEAAVIALGEKRKAHR